MRNYEVNRPYSQSQALLQFIAGLPSSFDEGGTPLWNGRNKIKTFSLAGQDGDQGVLDVVAKSFKRPSAIQKAVYALRTHKAKRAYLNGLELTRLGVATPEPVAYVELRQGPWLTAAYYISRPTNLQSIEGETDRPNWNRQLAADFGRYVAQLHAKGILHHDLNDTNVLFKLNDAGNYDFEVIDINRMSFYPDADHIPEGELLENLTRFTGNMELFEYVVRIYAGARRLADTEAFVARALIRKQRHDLRWRRRKAFCRLFKPKKK